MFNHLMAGTLYVVATPIGNLEDITLRAVRILTEVSGIVAEDTRTARKLLGRHHIRPPVLISYFAGNGRRRIPQILARLEQGEDIALISEAGTPSVSDPGADLVRAASDAEIRVVTVPGPSAGPALLSVSGMPSDRYMFLGFLPRKSAERARLLEIFVAAEWPLVAFESPHRLRASLENMVSVFGAERHLVIGRELTKRFEEIYRGPIGQASERFERPRGEFTLVVAPADRQQRRAARPTPQSLTDPAPQRSRRSRSAPP